MSNAGGWQCLPGLGSCSPLCSGQVGVLVPPSCISISLPMKWGHGAEIDLGTAFWKCSRFFPLAFSEWRSSPHLSSRFLPKLGSHHAHVCARKQRSSFYIIPLANTHILSGKIQNAPLDPIVLMLPECLRCEISSGFQISLWGSLNLCLMCRSRSSPDCPVAFLNMPTSTAMHEGQVNPQPEWPDFSPSQAGMQPLRWVCCQSLVWITEKL